ncbi:2Fe-2S iron-sulfur cluster-binding protein [Paraburkholderia domus]|uniref:2Fe-2S iron-sulfur cluster-binding protein n=1 Tax=Paraburkholderia domus TaxID=2793075 RepID=UPI0019131C06|nr:2Fe-2S iron-sulfur cluster-binding protein [Paraburkholderia domus]MBK5065919.1 2Fe-2S iron-sulfur cluster binding domain-containing protein [Burkholderia sp. R-70199]CAE6959464.1 Ferredoxin-6 [Paraburkholderia domus]
MSEARITFITADGEQHAVSAPCGWTLMEAAVKHGVPGIVAECGGSCACATCHMYIDSEWVSKATAPQQIEREMLEWTAEPATERSRLGCQVPITSELDGIVIRVPTTQL